MRVFGWNEHQLLGPPCDFTEKLAEKSWRHTDEHLLGGYKEIFLLDTPDTVRASRDTLFRKSSATVSERVRELLFLDWRHRAPGEKVPGSFEVFSDPELLALVGVDAPAKVGSKFSVDSSAIPKNLELQCWSNCMAFQKYACLKSGR